MSEIKQRVLARVRECLILAEKSPHLPDGFTFKPDFIRFDLKGVCAGQFRYYTHGNKRGLRLNMHYLKTELDDMVATTIPHEMAHLIDFDCTRAKWWKPTTSHGRNWRRVMLDVFGLPADVYHAYDVAHAKPYVYGCGCRVHRLSTRLHTAIRRGRTRHCLQCNETLFFIKKGPQ